MIASLASLLPRLRILLFDEDSLIWNPNQLVECIQMSLDGLQSVCPFKLSLAGLDEAAITVLDAGMISHILRMSQVYAWELRLRLRAETYHPDAQPQAERQTWLESERKALLQELERYRLSYLQSEAAPPYSAWPAPAAAEDGPEDV